MWIFYKHLPSGVTLREIKAVTRKGCRSGVSLLRCLKKSIIKRAKIIRILDPRDGSVEYHAIVQVDSEATADRIVEKITGKTVNGLFVTAHRYQKRFPARDRRRSYKLMNDSHTERRRLDRRRPNLIIAIVETS